MMQRLRRFARYWDLVGNSGNFVESTPLIWSQPGQAAVPSTTPQRLDFAPSLACAPGTELEAGWKPVLPSPFAEFLHWSDWLYGREKRTDGIALARLAGLLFEYLTCERGLASALVAESLWRDWQRAGRRDAPEFLRAHLGDATRRVTSLASPVSLKRQARHRGLVRPAGAAKESL
jgi:hypothetical protein